MRTAIRATLLFTEQSKIRKALSLCLRILLAAVLSCGTLCAVGQQPATQPTSPHFAAHKPVHRHKRLAAAHKPAPVEQTAPVPVAPPAPKPPDWPVNDQPADANVVWNSQGLRIEASNSSLKQILTDVATSTGVKLEGLGADQRIFGVFGPGKARDVLAQLLDGTGYNVLMIGDLGEGTPRQILLSTQPSGDAPPAANNQTATNEENSDADTQPEPQPPPPPIRNGFTPGAPPRTPQQIMQEMQQRQQQQQQQNGPQ